MNYTACSLKLSSEVLKNLSDSETWEMLFLILNLHTLHLNIMVHHTLQDIEITGPEGVMQHVQTEQTQSLLHHANSQVRRDNWRLICIAEICKVYRCVYFCSQHYLLGPAAVQCLAAAASQCAIEKIYIYIFFGFLFILFMMSLWAVQEVYDCIGKTLKLCFQ